MLGYEECRLRPVRESDLNKILEWRNSKHVRVHMFTDHIITPEEHSVWFANIVKAQPPTFMIFERHEKPVGVATAGQIDRQSNRCYWGFYVGEPDAPRGTGLIMGYLALEYFFEQLNVRKICGEVLACNRASITYHRKLGFVQEGHLVEHVLKNDKYQDTIVFALFRKDWQKSKDGLAKLCFSGGRK